MNLKACLILLALAPTTSLATDAVSGSTKLTGTGAIIAQCEACHGPGGASTDPRIPIIGGVSSRFLSTAVWAYQDGAWPCREIRYPGGNTTVTDHCSVARGLSNDAATAIAAHFARQPFVRAKQTADPELAARGRALHNSHCEKCHTNGGTDAADDAGILSGQWQPALRSIFADYLAGKRSQPKTMKAKMNKLSSADTDALIHFYGSDLR